MLHDLERFLTNLNKRELSQNTIRGYFKNLKPLIVFLISNGKGKFSQISLDEFKLFREYLNQKGLSKNWKTQILTDCHQFLRFLGLAHVIPNRKKPQLDSPLAWTLKDFINYLTAERGCGANTLSNYSRDVRRFLEYLAEIKVENLQQVDQLVITGFLKKLYEAGLGANSVRRTIGGCKTFFRFLKREEVITHNPWYAIEGPKSWQRCPDLLSVEEIAQIIEKPSLKTENGLRDRAIHELLYGSGLRVSELINLRVIDFHLAEGIVRVFGKGDKERLVPLSRQSIIFLCEYWRTYRLGIELHDFAFSPSGSFEGISRITIWGNVKKYTKQCGITKTVFPHTFRHSFACHMLDRGAEIAVLQSLLGHACIGTTGVYLQRSLAQVKETFYKHHPRDIYDNACNLVVEVV